MKAVGVVNRKAFQNKIKRISVRFAAKCYIFDSAVGGVCYVLLSLCLENPAERRTFVSCVCLV